MKKQLGQGGDVSWRNGCRGCERRAGRQINILESSVITDSGVGGRWWEEKRRGSLSTRKKDFDKAQL